MNFIEAKHEGLIVESAKSRKEPASYQKWQLVIKELHGMRVCNDEFTPEETQCLIDLLERVKQQPKMH